MKNTFEDHGLILEPRKKEDWVFGGFFGDMGPVVNPLGDWRDYLVEKEGQIFDAKDSYACATYATHNAYEILFKFLNKEENLSDRFTAILSGTKVGVGNSPQKVVETLRKNGCVAEQSLPLSAAKTIEEFYQPDPLPKNLKDEAVKTLLDEWTLNYRQLDSTDHTTLLEALKRSPVPVSVVAWYQNGAGEYFKPAGMNDNHLVCLVYADDTGYWIFDSDLGQEKLKKLSKDYFFSYGEVIYISNEPSPLSVPWYLKLLDLLGKLLHLDSLLLKEREKAPVPALPSNTTAPTPTPPQNAPQPQKPPSLPPTEARWLIENPSTAWAVCPSDLKRKLIARTRDICYEEGLDVRQTKNLICTIQGESGFNPACVNEQTKDYGVCQFSARYYLVEYKMTPQYACEHPEECIRIMAKNWKTRASNWCAFQNEGYKRWLNYSDEDLVNFQPNVV